MNKKRLGDVNLFKYDSALSNGLARITDILVLNVLWIICSLPVVTLGASTAALYYSMIKIVRKNDSGIVKMFFYAYFQNMKQGCVLTILFLSGGITLYFGIQTYNIIGGLVGKAARVILIILFIMWGILFSYVFPLLAQFENSIKKTIKNALIISIANFGKTVIIVFLNAIPIILFWGLPYVFVASLPIFTLWGIALIAFLNTKIFVKIFDKYITNEENS